MAYTDKTANYNLPQWVGSDHPDFLTDLNPAYETIDTELNKNATNITAMSQDVSNVVEGIGKLTTEYDTLNHQVADNTVDITNLQSNFGMAMSKINANTGNIASLQKTVNINTEDITKLKSDVASITGGVVLWSNPNPLVTFDPQTIVLSDSADNYEFIMLLYYDTTTAVNQYDKWLTYASGRKCNLQSMAVSGGLYLHNRVVTFNTDTNVILSAANSIKYDGTTSVNNLVAIPIAMYGFYKKEGV